MKMKKNVAIIIAVLAIMTTIIGVVNYNRVNRYNWRNHHNEPVTAFSRVIDDEIVFEIYVDGKCDTWPQNLEYYESPVTSELFRSAFEIASKQHAGEDVKSILFRDAIQEEIQKAIDEQYEEGTFTVINVSIFDYNYEYKLNNERSVREYWYLIPHDEGESFEDWYYDFIE